MDWDSWNVSLHQPPPTHSGRAAAAMLGAFLQVPRNQEHWPSLKGRSCQGGALASVSFSATSIRKFIPTSLGKRRGGEITSYPSRDPQTLEQKSEGPEAPEVRGDRARRREGSQEGRDAGGGMGRARLALARASSCPFGPRGPCSLRKWDLLQGRGRARHPLFPVPNSSWGKSTTIFLPRSVPSYKRFSPPAMPFLSLLWPVSMGSLRRNRKYFKVDLLNLLPAGWIPPSGPSHISVPKRPFT